MHLRLIAVSLLIASVLGSAAAPQVKPPAPPVPCQDHSVDEYLAEMHKRKRNKNPLPGDACFFGWCHYTGEGKRDMSDLPPPPEGPPREPTPKRPGESSSKPSTSASSEEVPARSLYNPIGAAKSVEAGDYYFDQKNYRAALSRYQEALQDKSDDAAIHLRLGRAFEKLEQLTPAYEHFDASLILSPEGPTARAAQEGVNRLRAKLAALGSDLAAIHAGNAAAIAASCR